MASVIERFRMKVSAQDATTITLVPEVGEKTVPDLAAEITQVVITMTARDTKFFDIVNRRFNLELEKR